MSPISPIFPFKTALEVFLELLQRFDPRPAWKWDGSGAPEHCPNALCDRLCAIGMQKRSTEMGALELLICPRVKMEPISDELFGGSREINLTEELIARMVHERVIEPDTVWESSRKHARHVETGLLVIFHLTTTVTYSNRLKELQQSTAEPFDSMRNCAGMEKLKAA